MRMFKDVIETEKSKRSLFSTMLADNTYQIQWSILFTYGYCLIKLMKTMDERKVTIEEKIKRTSFFNVLTKQSMVLL